jgi:hypothetical protein
MATESDRKAVRKFQRDQHNKALRNSSGARSDSDRPPQLPVAVREYDALAAVATDHVALAAKAAEVAESRQISRWGTVTAAADRAFLAKLSDHDLQYLILNDPA